MKIGGNDEKWETLLKLHIEGLKTAKKISKRHRGRGNVFGRVRVQQKREIK